VNGYASFHPGGAGTRPGITLDSPPDPTLTTRERNIIIRARYAAGVSQAELARQFGISYQRIHQIVHGRRK
jgi:ribosome-binding protein aMBF1 (putative translation factor)